MSARARAALVALLGALLLGSLLAAPTSGAAADGPRENVTFTVELADDGDARWTVRATFALETDAQQAAFEDLADDYNAGRTTALGLEAFQNASNEAAAVTGRSMAITDIRRGAAPSEAIENGTGWLSLSFTWTNFARVGEEGDLHVGDAFNTTQGTWLSRLDGDEVLVVKPPSSHNPFTGDCELSEGGFRCTGPMRFPAGSPTWEFTSDGNEGVGGVLRAALIVAGLLSLLVLVFLMARRRDSLPRPSDVEDVVASEDTDDDPPAEPVAESSADDEDEVDVELLSDEERVERLLEQNGGRMKQASIVKETGWSNAKVSQLLSAMAEEDRIDKLRIGRENLISFPDEDVTDVDE